MAINVVSLTGSYLSRYRAAPAAALKQWSQVEDTVFLDGASYILSPDRFKRLLTSPLLASDFRSVSSPDCLGTQAWAMYKEGSSYHFSRSASTYRINACLQWLHDLNTRDELFLPASNVSTPTFVRHLLTSCYADVFGVARSSIADSYDTMLRLHHSALKGDVDGVNDAWRDLRVRQQLRTLDDFDLSLLVFFVADTASSIVHFSLLSQRDVCKSLGEVDTAIRSLPPFLYAVRVAREEFAVDDLLIDAGRRVLIPLVSENSQAALPFGLGHHKCPGRNLALKLVQYVSKNRCADEFKPTLVISPMTQFMHVPEQ